ncbi:unnamed protein product [Prorocentrum cordatum]|uniref:Secreted protein n=1 Tax=Prorocentrum cordatum TaxID=2364126 RepID=A0ABN9QF59_9DINO|nr:unnamed protein product [Polarella glacialis]
MTPLGLLPAVPSVAILTQVAGCHPNCQLPAAMTVLLCGPGLMAHSRFDCAALGRFRVSSSTAGKCGLGEPAKVHVEWSSPYPSRPARALQHLPNKANVAMPEGQTSLRRRERRDACQCRWGDPMS